ncbi:MAG: hypothetical protein ACR2J7_09830 [Luteimonas sp.]
MFKKRMILAVLAVAALPVKAGEYSIFPVTGTDVTSQDGRTWMVDVIDTEYKRGTFMLDLQDGSYQSIVGNRVDSGSLPGDLSTTDVAAVQDEVDVAAWNQQVAAGQSPQANRVVSALIKYCKLANQQAFLALQVAQAACHNAGGTHSGGSIGFCGVGSDTGRCSGRYSEIER